eukprot:1042620_1
MLSSFIALLLIISKYQVQSQNGDVCIWGRRGWYSVLNGAYTYRGLYNDAPWYSKNIHPSWGQHGFNNVTYLWRNNRNYTLSDYPPSSTSNIYHAFCQSSSLHVYDCDRNWRFTDSMTNDMGMFAQNGSCPFWDCDQIITSGITFTWAIKCEGPFDVQIAPNAWTNSASTDEYWYFHTTTFQWVCAASYDLQPWSSLWEWTDPGWHYVSKGSTIWLNFTNFQNDSQHLQQIDCIMNPTLSPTNNPTVSTNYPSITPTSHPSIVPTIHPTLLPSSDPTLTPTLYPTNTPSDTPSDDPTILPTDVPTLIPTSIPTHTPTLIPTAIPSDNPTLIPTHDPSRSPFSTQVLTTTENTASTSLSTDIAETAGTLTITTRSDEIRTTFIPKHGSEHNKSDSTFWTIFSVFAVILSILIVSGCAMMIYRYRKGLKDDQESVYRINRDNASSIANPQIQLGATPAHRINRIQSLSYADDPKHDEFIQDTVDEVLPKIGIQVGDTNQNDDVKDDMDVVTDLPKTEGGETMGATARISGNLNNVEVQPCDTEGMQATGSEITEGQEGTTDNSVEEWITNKAKLPQYYHTFIENGYDTLEIIKEITDNNQLQEIGVLKKGHMMKLMIEINILKTEMDGNK